MVMKRNNKRSKKPVNQVQVFESRDTRYPDPPPYTASIVGNNIFRFAFTANVSEQIITLKDLLGVPGVVGNTASSSSGVSYLCEAVKINWIEMWSPPVTGDNLVFTWNANSQYFSKAVTKQDICNSTAVPAHLFIRPPKKALTADWMSVSSGFSDISLFTVNGQTNTTFDINLSFQYYSGVSGSSQQTGTTIGATIGGGVLKYSYLDGIGGPGHIAPVILPSVY
jgi:hypothetical protein